MNSIYIYLSICLNIYIVFVKNSPLIKNKMNTRKFIYVSTILKLIVKSSFLKIKWQVKTLFIPLKEITEVESSNTKGRHWRQNNRYIKAFVDMLK